jgi:hypothetical protein
MKTLLIALVLLSLGADSSRKGAVALDEFGSLFPLADKLENFGSEIRKAAGGNERLLGQAEGYEKAAALVREEIAAIRALRRKQVERESRP